VLQAFGNVDLDHPERLQSLRNERGRVLALLVDTIFWRRSRGKTHSSQTRFVALLAECISVPALICFRFDSISR